MKTVIPPSDTTCGIAMPISAIDSYPKEHWEDVLFVIETSIRECGFIPNLVSDGAESGVIQKRIIENLYSNPIVVCDVSAKNPNCMFELGMRLAFDKPTVVIRDDETPFFVDTSIIEHIIYPRDLKPRSIETFRGPRHDFSSH